MKLAAPHRRQPVESVIPMINVVFLLLIFFLMSARLTAPAPVEVNPPVSSVDRRSSAENVLHADTAGLAAFGDLQGEQAIAAFLANACQPDCPSVVTLRADRAAPARTIAALVARLSASGVGDVELVTIQ